MLDGSLINVRRATHYDVFDMVQIAQKAYSDWPVDWGFVSEWLSNNIERPEIFGCITDGAASIAISQDWFWRPKIPEITVLFIAGRNVWRCVRLLRATARWGLSLGAENMKVDSETSVNLGPLVRRVGFRFKPVPAYTVRLQ